MKSRVIIIAIICFFSEQGVRISTNKTFQDNDEHPERRPPLVQPPPSLPDPNKKQSPYEPFQNPGPPLVPSPPRR